MMKKKLAMLLALVMTVTSIEGSALAVRGADFGSEPVKIAEEAEPPDCSRGSLCEGSASEASREFFDEFTAEEAPEIEAGAEGSGIIFLLLKKQKAPQKAEKRKQNLRM